MPVVLDTTVPKLRTIDGIGYTEQDSANARVWAKGKGLIPEDARGALKSEYITAWYKDGAQEFDTAKTPSNDDEVVATLSWHKIGKNGVISQRKEYDSPITRGMVREARGLEKKNRFSSDDFLKAVVSITDEEMAPYRITTAKGDIHNITTDESGELSIEDNPAATKRALVARIKELEARLAEYEGESAEETEAE